MYRSNLVYRAFEIFSKFDEVQQATGSALIPKIINEEMNDVIYVINKNILNSLLEE